MTERTNTSCYLVTFVVNVFAASSATPAYIMAVGGAGSLGSPALVSGNAVVVANGAETEPLSAKDRMLMTARPHLVLDGVLLAVEAVAAARAVLYISRAHDDAAQAMTAAIAERRGDLAVPVSVVRAPHRYVAGEETAAIAHLNGGAARPTMVPPRPYERGVDGRPTVVQNVATRISERASSCESRKELRSNRA